MIAGASSAPGRLGGAVVSRMAPPEANAALLGRSRDRPGFAASRDRVKRHIGLKEALGVGGGAVIGDFDGYRCSESDSLTSWDNEAWFLYELYVFPLGVGGDSLVKPLIGD
ncbi:hypothetical protein AX14_011690 [Amanita brunnescens Koide BX004]|nr:hypothetical protein AX14_011690 [Amanita brunnescens Koide BX004]